MLIQKPTLTAIAITLLSLLKLNIGNADQHTGTNDTIPSHKSLEQSIPKEVSALGTEMQQAHQHAMETDPDYEQKVRIAEYYAEEQLALVKYQLEFFRETKFTELKNFGKPGGNNLKTRIDKEVEALQEKTETEEDFKQELRTYIDSLTEQYSVTQMGLNDRAKNSLIELIKSHYGLVAKINAANQACGLEERKQLISDKTLSKFNSSDDSKRYFHLYNTHIDDYKNVYTSAYNKGINLLQAHNIPCDTQEQMATEYSELLKESVEDPLNDLIKESFTNGFTLMAIQSELDSLLQ